MGYDSGMGFPVVVSDAIKRRVEKFPPARLYAFQLAVADISKGRARGEQVHTSPATGRVFYSLRREPYTLYYSVDPKIPNSLVFEEFLDEGESDLIMDLFAEGKD